MKALALLLAAALALSATEEAGAPVETVTVRALPVTKPVRADGVTAFKHEARLSFKTGGVIAAVTADEGDRVEKGALLAELDPTEIDAALSRAKSALEKAERDHRRAAHLYKEKVATQEERDDAATGLEMAQAAYDQARFNRELALLAAPEKGVVLKRMAQPGEIAAPGHPLFLFAPENDPMVLRVRLTDGDALRLRAGDPAEVRLYADREHPLEGKVSMIGDMADPATGLVPCEITLPSSFRAPAGLAAFVRVVPGLERQALVVPIRALVRADGKRGELFVYRPETGTVEKRNVEIGQLFDDGAAIVRGLAQGERVVTSGAPYLKEGERVRPVSGE